MRKLRPMMGAGAHNHRIALAAGAGDALPTAATIDAAKRVAARVCCEAAAQCAWVDPQGAQAWVAVIPLVALAALAEVCLDVKRERLARCLRLDPLDGVDELDRRRGHEDWPADQVEQVVLAIRGGR